MTEWPNLLLEWEERARLLGEAADFFAKDACAKAYAQGCLLATRRCIDDLRAGGEWIKGYEAGLKKGLRERSDATSSSSSSVRAEGETSGSTPQEAPK